MDAGQKIVDGLNELVRKLRTGEPIPTTRLERCPSCSNDPDFKPDCETCHGKGFIRYQSEL